jgi:predicted alpha/beta superfamily hydrolase/Tfp pilus assembly protein PilF
VHLSNHQQTISFLSVNLYGFFRLIKDNINTKIKCRGRNLKILLTKSSSKARTQLSTTFAVLSLLLLSLFSSANEVSRSNVSEIKINLGEKIGFYSNNLKEQREFFVRLPDSYQETKRDYPVIYLLDANNETLTYMKNLYFHSVTQIQRLMKQGDIPESIIVGIPFKSSQWFSNVSNNSEPFKNYLTKELSIYINDNYRTANSNILIGQSYSALFVINSLPTSSNTFDSYVAIEPILANGELEKATNNYQNLAIDNAKLQIIMGGTSFLDQAKVLSKKITSSAGKVVDISIETYLKESHASVYYPALNSGLRNHFEDYRRPSKEQILTQNFNYQSILKYFEKRASKYQVETTDKLIQFAVYDTIYNQIMVKNFKQAFDLWPIWKSQYKMYNANNIANNFIRNGDRAAAITFLQHVSKAMPKAVRALDKLATLHQQDNKLEQASLYRLKAKQLLSEIFSKPISTKQEDSLNRYGYSLLSEGRSQEAIKVFQRITQEKPDSINAYDSLADAYESVKRYPEAIKAVEKAIALANSKDNVNIASFQQRLSRLKKTKVAG